MPRCGGAGRGGRRRAVRREGNAIASASVDVVRGGVEVVWCGGCVEVVTGL